MSATATRRAMLGAIAAAPVIAASCTTASAAAADTSAWDKAWSEYQRIRAEERAFDAMFGPAYAAWTKGAPNSETIDWTAFPFEHRSAVLHTIDLDERLAQRRASEGKTWWAGDGGARFNRAIEHVREYRRLKTENDAAHGIDALNARSDELGDQLAEAEGVLLNTPAPHGAALLWKLNHLLDTGGSEDPHSTSSWSACYLGTTMDAARRLLSGEG